MKLKSILIIIFIFLLSFLYAKNPKNPKSMKNTKSTKSTKDTKDTGLELGEKLKFETKGKFNISTKILKKSIQINLPVMEKHRFVIYRSMEKEGTYTKIGITKKTTFIDKKLFKGTDYYYVAVALVKEKNQWKQINSSKTGAVIEIKEVITEVSVNFTSVPKKAVVIINNENIGNTPVVKKYKVGEYQLTMQKEGYKTYKDFKFNVEYKKNMKVNIKLEKIKGSINITTTPPGASIKLNRKVIGKSPLRKDNLDLATYTIEAALKDYQPIKKAVILNSETPASVNLTLSKTPVIGSVRIDSNPKGADIFIDNIKRGRTPYIVKNLNAGIHALILKKKDHNDIINEIEIEANIQKNYNFTFVKEHGFLSVKTSPNSADCFLNEKLIGKTPVNSLKINKGIYNLAIRKENYTDFKEMIRVDVGQHFKRDIILSMQKATLIINTYPDKATVKIQGKSYGFTPFMSDNIQPGKITLNITKPGFEPIFRQLSLSPDSKENLYFSLKALPAPRVVTPPTGKPSVIPTPLPVKQVPPAVKKRPVVRKGTLSATTSPPGAAFYLNNKYYGRTPFILSLMPGKYKIKFKRSLYKEWNGSVIIQAGIGREVNIKLSPVETYLKINSTPPGADIYINNINYGKTPGGFNIPAGNHVLNLKKQHYDDYSAELKITGARRRMTKHYRMKKEVKKYLFTSIPPNAEVFLNKRMIGLTPFEYLDIKDGLYNIKFKRTGCRPWQKKIKFSMGNPPRITANLIALRGDLLIRSTPPSCNIYVNNNRVGVSGNIIKNIHAGYHNIRVTKEGYYDYNGRIRIYDNRVTSHRVHLIEKPKGNLSINSTPMNAKVYINSLFRGATPLLLEGLTENKYRVRLKLNSHKTYKTIVTVLGNRTEYINAALIPGSDCCLSNYFFSKPVLWYIASGLLLGGAGWAWYEENRALKAGKGKYRSVLHDTRNGLAYASGGCLLIGLTLHIAFD